MKHKITIWAGVILLVAVAGIAAWHFLFSATRIAFVNYQATTLGQIARANDHTRIRLSSIEPSEFGRLGRYDVVLVNGMGLRITAEERAALQQAADRGLAVITTMATNPANEILSADSATVATVKGILTAADDATTTTCSPICAARSTASGSTRMSPRLRPCMKRNNTTMPILRIAKPKMWSLTAWRHTRLSSPSTGCLIRILRG